MGVDLAKVVVMGADHGGLESVGDDDDFISPAAIGGAAGAFQNDSIDIALVSDGPGMLGFGAGHETAEDS